MLLAEVFDDLFDLAFLCTANAFTCRPHLDPQAEAERVQGVHRGNAVAKTRLMGSWDSTTFGLASTRIG